MSTPDRGAAHWFSNVLEASKTSCVQVGDWLGGGGGGGGGGGETVWGGETLPPPPPPPHAVNTTAPVIRAVALASFERLDFAI